jgi:hypothetical protein
MKTKFSAPLLVLGFTLLPVAAQAEESALAKNIKKSMPTQVTAVSGSLGATESGATVGAGAQLSNAKDIPVAFVDVQAGSPILRIAGRAEGVPIQIKAIEDGEHGFKLQIIPVKGSTQLTLPSSDSFTRSHILINPSVVAQYQFKGKRFTGKARLRVGPNVGIAMDGDSTGVLAGVNLGVDLEARVRLSPDVNAIARYAVDQYTTVTDTLEDGFSHCFEMGFEKRTSDGNVLTGGVTAQKTKFDIADHGRNQDDGSADLVGVFARLNW